MPRNEWLFGKLCSNGEFGLPPNHAFQTAEGVTFYGDLRGLRAKLAGQGFRPVTGDRYCQRFTDGRSTFRAIMGTGTGLYGLARDQYTLRQVWG